MGCTATIDTRATLTILRRDVLGSTFKYQMSSPELILKTAVGETARVYGEIHVQLQLGHFKTVHKMLIADITDGLDIMKRYGFVLDIQNRVLRIGCVR